MLFSIRRNPLFFVSLFVPAMFITGFFILFPLVNGVRLSFTDATPLSATESYVGIENFEFLFEDPDFWEVVGNTLYMIGTATVLALLLGFCIALLLNSGLRGVRFFRVAIFQVWVVPWIVIAILWGWLFSEDYGLVNYLLLSTGFIDQNVKWLFTPHGSQIAIILAYTWRSIPFMMVVSLAALQGIPKELLESAAIDGAGFFRQLVYIIVPLLRNILLVVALLQSVRFFQEMTMPFVLTQGGPVNATMVLSLYTYKLAFDSWDFGLASAVGTFWLVILLLFAVVYVRAFVRQIN